MNGLMTLWELQVGCPISQLRGIIVVYLSIITTEVHMSVDTGYYLNPKLYR